MSTILVCAGMHDRDRHDAAVQLLQAKAKPGVRVLGGLWPPPEGIDWKHIRDVEGGWEAAYEWAAREHTGICVIPIDGRTVLSRGVCTLAEKALALGKPVLAAVPHLAKVALVYVVDPGEYKGVHGRLVWM